MGAALARGVGRVNPMQYSITHECLSRTKWHSLFSKICGWLLCTNAETSRYMLPVMGSWASRVVAVVGIVQWHQLPTTQPSLHLHTHTHTHTHTPSPSVLCAG